jgi:hypothetical protein
MIGQAEFSASDGIGTHILLLNGLYIQTYGAEVIYINRQRLPVCCY